MRDLCQQMFAIGVEPDDVGIMLGGESVDQPGPHRIDSGDRTQIDMRDLALKGAQLLGQRADCRQRQAAREAHKD